MARRTKGRDRLIETRVHVDHDAGYGWIEQDWELPSRTVLFGGYKIDGVFTQMIRRDLFRVRGEWYAGPWDDNVKLVNI
jgi:hypothetical protein